jgi:hypothetical protein
MAEEEEERKLIQHHYAHKSLAENAREFHLAEHSSTKTFKTQTQPKSHT